MQSNNRDSIEAAFTEHAEITRQRNLTLNDMAVARYRRKDYRGAITLFNQVIETEKTSGNQKTLFFDFKYLTVTDILIFFSSNIFNFAKFNFENLKFFRFVGGRCQRRTKFCQRFFF